jgi:unsaturated rhamnogalacturonyl hydrolase
MNRVSLLIPYYLISTMSFGQTAAATYSVKFSNAIISRWPTTINAMTGKNWEYSNSIILHGMEKVYNDTTNVNYLTYIKKYVESYVDSSGNFNFTLAQTLDNIHPGILCLFCYEKTGLTKFKTAATKLRDYLVAASSSYPKTPDGGYWHKGTSAAYTNVMMLDGIYMAHPFLVKYGRMFNDPVCYDTATSQTLMLASHLYDNTIHLTRHAWNYDKSKSWANATTGNSSEVWSRAMGWYTMALVDMLKYLPSTHSKYAAIKSLLANLAIGIQNTQDPVTGLWYQVMNKQDSAANYLETSGSAMFVYALKVAADSGWISSSYLTVAQKGWTGLKANSISTYSGDGKPEIDGFAPAMSVQNNYTLYVTGANTPVNTPTTTHPHGYAAILMAASVMEFPLSSASLPVKFSHFTATASGSEVALDWANPDTDGEVNYYSIQRSYDGISFTSVGRVNASHAAAYRWTDNPAAANTIYYRIGADDVDGAMYYSGIQTVRYKNSAPGMTVSPNPVNSRLVTLHLSSVRPGPYNVYFINSEGKTTAATAVQVPEGAQNLELALPNNLQKGLYYIRLDIGTNSITQNLLIN